MKVARDRKIIHYKQPLKAFFRENSMKTAHLLLCNIKAESRRLWWEFWRVIVWTLPSDNRALLNCEINWLRVNGAEDTWWDRQTDEILDHRESPRRCLSSHSDISAVSELPIVIQSVKLLVIFAPEIFQNKHAHAHTYSRVCVCVSSFSAAEVKEHGRCQGGHGEQRGVLGPWILFSRFLRSRCLNYASRLTAYCDSNAHLYL